MFENFNSPVVAISEEYVENLMTHYYFKSITYSLEI